MSDTAALDALRRIQDKRSTVTVVIEGEKIVLHRPKAAEYQKIISMAVNQSDRDSDKILDFMSHCLSAVVPGLNKAEAMDIIASTGGFRSDLVQKTLEVCGLQDFNEIRESVDEAASGN